MTRKGANGVITNGVTVICMFFDRDFLGTPVNLLLSSQKCQGVPFCLNLSTLITFAAAPFVLTPFVRNQDDPDSDRGGGGGGGRRRRRRVRRRSGILIRGEGLKCARYQVLTSRRGRSEREHPQSHVRQILTRRAQIRAVRPRPIVTQSGPRTRVTDAAVNGRRQATCIVRYE